MVAPSALIVDDDPGVRELLRDRLESAGYDVVVASEGKAALELYQTAPTDVVITDIVMPEMDGQELIEELLLRFPDVRIVAISGDLEGESSDLLADATRAGATRTLAKPFSTPQLLETVEAVLGDRT